MFTALSFSFLLVIVAYLLGSIPTGYLTARYLKGIDIREHGSGSTGATNVLRIVGKPAAIAVLLIDLLKGSAAVILVNLAYARFSPTIFPPDWLPWLVMSAAIAAIIGHSKSVWLNFTGGKSVATSLGILLAISPVLGLGTLGSFLIVLAISRIVSLSSIVGAIVVNILAIALHLPLPYMLFTGLAGIYVIFRHQANIQRLLVGEEPQIGQMPKNS
ncbi:glycerol-3-phosphate 1-O-acyltransferase PlsY [Myxosarcina sp. GI1]|uniref:glycerol-3-phosphate 1-O-acyltransferase PlsY n=1 Tax=Myxosarcina sp. GI1 TaxID=1541065 RepID=UPI00055C0756|nr:glycerol-3-phosphate 1-O-acyltransferase PlsY [Myxosarcina sp. GI1]